MKKILAAGLLAIFVIAASQQQASAWVNSKFAIGMTLDMQSGGNSFAWGLWRNGQPPGYGPTVYGPHHHYAPPVSYAPPVGYPMYGMAQPSFAPQYAYAPALEYPMHGSFSPAAMQPAPYQFANYPYYVPTPTYDYYGR